MEAGAQFHSNDFICNFCFWGFFCFFGTFDQKKEKEYCVGCQTEEETTMVSTASAEIARSPALESKMRQVRHQGRGRYDPRGLVLLPYSRRTRRHDFGPVHQIYILISKAPSRYIHGASDLDLASIHLGGGQG